MNLQQLHYFEKIAECQQYTLAAQQLHVTQATLSYAISNLERELNVKLFYRTGKQVELTACGKVYLTCVRDALQALERGNQMVRDMENPVREMIRLTYLESLKHLVMNTISDFYGGEEEPLLRFELTHSNAALIEQQLLRREADLGISTVPATAGIASHLIGYQSNVIIVPKRHPWAEKKSISLSELDRQKMIAYSQDCVIRGYYDSIFRAAHVQPEIFAESRIHSNILDMVSYGMGVAIVPHMHWLTNREDVVSLTIQEDVPPRAIYLIWAEDAVFPPAVREFRDRIMEERNLEQYL